MKRERDDEQLEAPPLKASLVRLNVGGRPFDTTPDTLRICGSLEEKIYVSASDLGVGKSRLHEGR